MTHLFVGYNSVLDQTNHYNHRETLLSVFVERNSLTYNLIGRSLCRKEKSRKSEPRLKAILATVSSGRNHF